MSNPSKKEQIREWLAQRRTAPAPLPDLEQIRQQLGWDVLSKPVAPAASLAVPRTAIDTGDRHAAGAGLHRAVA